jgi:hypothetical protein
MNSNTLEFTPCIYRHEKLQNLAGGFYWVHLKKIGSKWQVQFRRIRGLLIKETCDGDKEIFIEKPLQCVSGCKPIAFTQI